MAILNRIRAGLIVLGCVLAVMSPLAAQQSTVEPTEAAPDGPISTVNGEDISAAVFQARVRVTYFLNIYTIRETLRGLLEQGLPADQAFGAVQNFYNEEINQMLIPDLMGAAVLDRLEEDRLLDQLASERGITVTDAEIDAQLEAFVARPGELTGRPDATPEAAAASLQSTLSPRDALYAEAARRVDVTAADIRDYFRGQELRGRFTDEAFGPFPTEWDHVTVRHIMVNTRDEADAVFERLNAGEDFAALAAELSTDTGSGPLGGELGTVVPELFVAPLATTLREAPLNEVLEPIETEFGFHVVEVTARETQPLDDTGITALIRYRATNFRAWLDEQFDGAQIERVDNWPDLIPRTPSGETLLSEMLGEL